MGKIVFKYGFIGLFVLTASCAHNKKAPEVGTDPVQALAKNAVENQQQSALRKIAQQEQVAPIEVSSILDALNIQSKTAVQVAPLPLVYNESVRSWVEYFAVRDKERFQRFMNRGEPYRPFIYAALKKYKLPLEFYYLAMIESGFVKHAYSRASAVGFWQFMKGTGKDYGLKVTHYIDERRDPYQATDAAARYLRDLHNSLGSWELAAAAYNCGQRCVRRSIRKGGTRDFWELRRKKLLPRETREYVPKLMAATLIGENFEKFGFRKPTNEKLQQASLVKVPGGISLKSISQIGGVSYSNLVELNPHIKRKHIPSSEVYYEIWAPLADKSKIENKYSKLLSVRQKTPVRKRRRSVARNRRYHRVKSGEHLTAIAKRYGVKTKDLRSWNNIKGSRIFAGQTIKVFSSKAVSGQASSHRVRRGETLSQIAKKYGVSAQAIKKLNRLKSSRIYSGQKLSLIKASQQKAKRHRVRRGDNLTEIAKSYGLSVSRLKRLNGLKTSKIYIGQVLKVITQ